MRTRLFPALFVASLTAALVVAQERPGQPGQPGQPGKGGDKGGQPGTATSLDGQWTVVSAARDGKAVDGTDKMTVTIKGNVVTFTAGVGGQADKQMRALRLDFGPNGTVRVAEANADGKFADPGTRPGGDRPGGDKDRPGGERPGTAAQPGGAGQPGGTAATGGTMTGVYVLTPDYLAVSVFDAGTGTRPGDRPGADRPPAGAAGQPGTGAGQPGTGAAGADRGPQVKSLVSVILKRTGAGGGRP
jgi:hypothetical protein